MLDRLLDETKELVNDAAITTGYRIRVAQSGKGYMGKAYLSSLLEPGQDELVIGVRSNVASPDYVVAHEAARLLRLWDAPPDERFLIASKLSNRALAYAQMDRDVAEWPQEAREQSRRGYELFFAGILTQLGSMPADPWLDAYLLQQHPALEAEVVAGLEEAFQTAHRVLGEQIRRLTPQTVYLAANGMNASYSQQTDELLNSTKYSAPYIGTEWQELGSKLVQHNVTDRGSVGDRQTANLYAEELNLRNWYWWQLLHLREPGIQSANHHRTSTS